MQPSFCEHVRTWLAVRGAESSGQPPPVDLSAHVARCAQCRGALVLLLATLLDVPMAPPTVTCAMCQEDLAAFLDLERGASPTAAARRYPHVWWHLWTCTDCAETYQMTSTLLTAEQAEELVSIPLLAPPPPRHPVITPVRLARGMLRRVFAPPALVGVARGDHRETVLFDGEAGGSELTIRVRRAVPGVWHVLIMVDPPIVGAVVLTLGAREFYASLAPDGTAVVGPLPGELLTAPDGPDVLIMIIPADVG